MRSYLLILVIFIQNYTLAQTKIDFWSKNIKVRVLDTDNINIVAKVSFLESGKEHQAKYDVNSKEFIFDSIPYIQGEIKITAEGYESQTNKILPGTNIVRTYYLGKPGSAYMVMDDYLMPYKKNPGVYGIFISGNSTDSVLTVLKAYFKKKGYEFQGTYYKGLLVQVKAFKKISPQFAIQELLNHPNISEAGEVYGQNEITGFFSCELTVTFDGLGTDEMERLIEKYNFTIISSRGVTYRVRLKEGTKETITNIALRMKNEPGVRMIYHRIIDYVAPPTTD